MTGSTRLWLVGGEDIHFREPLARVLASRGIGITLVGTCQNEQCQVSSEFEHSHYALDRRFRPLSDIQTIAQLRSAFRIGRPDLIHSFDTKPNILAPIAARALPGRIVVRTITGLGSVFEMGGYRGRIYRKVYMAAHRLASKSCALTVFQNQEDMSVFMNAGILDRSRCQLILGSGVDVEGLSQAAESVVPAEVRKAIGVGDERIVLMAARMAGQKGVRDYIEAARILKSRSEHVTFLLAGQLEPEAVDAVPEREIIAAGKFVRYLGPRRDVSTLLAITDVAVLPTYREGAPRFVMEAQALGVAVVTCDVPGCRDVVDAGVTGILVRPRDPQQLADAISRLINSSTLRGSMGEAGKRRVLNEMSLDVVADRYIACYENVLSQNDSHAV